MDKLQVELRPGGCIARSMISVKGGTSGSGPPPFFVFRFAFSIIY